MSNPFVEINNDNKNKRLFKIARNYLLPLITLIIVTIIYNVWSSKHNRLAFELGDKFYNLVNATEMSAVEKIEGLREITDTNYQYFAQLQIADLLSQEEKIEEAQTIYQHLANDSNCVAYVKDLAQYRLSSLNTTAMTEGNNSIYYFSNKLMKAIKLLDENKLEEGQVILKELKENFETPFTIKEIAQELLLEDNNNT